MAIISVSIGDDLVEDLDRLQKSMGAGRSEVVRAGIRQVVQEERQRMKMGLLESAVLMVTHADIYDDEVARIKHDHEDLIKTHMHNKIDGERCVEVFVMGGPGKKIIDMTNGFLANRKMDNVKLVVL